MYYIQKDIFRYILQPSLLSRLYLNIHKIQFTFYTFIVRLLSILISQKHNMLKYLATKTHLISNPIFRFTQTDLFNKKYKYYRQIGEYLSLKIGKINSEIQYTKNQPCYLYGIKGALQQQLLENSQQNMLHNKKFESQQKENDNILKDSVNKEQKQQIDFTDRLGRKIRYSYDRTQKQIVQFETAIKIAQQFDMDLCVLQQNQSQPKLILKEYRKSIYQRFYEKQLKKKSVKQQKTILVSQKTQIFDIIHKARNIDRLINQGLRKFRIVSDNDSENAKSNIEKICELINQPKSQLVLEKKQKTNNFTKQLEQQWVAYVNMDKQVPLDIKLIQKRFKRIVIQQRLSKIPKKQRKKIDLSIFPLQLQQEYLKFAKESGTPFPQGFKDIQQTLAFKSTKQMIEYDIRDLPKRQFTDAKNLRIQHDFLKDQYTPQQIKQMQNSAKNIATRTIQQIIGQIQQIKQGNSFLGDFETHRLKVLQQQLKQTLYAAGYKKKI